ncbi:MAG: hypothetical protein GVY27_04935 [Deinococcus-Thermus bacterium]|jgi:hypothetical protein|nr:hypothetical protein [Deinococcota bacterium]
MTIILHNPNSPLSRRAVADLTDHEGVEIIDVVESTPASTTRAGARPR